MITRGQAAAIAVLSMEQTDLIDQAYEASDCWIFAYSKDGRRRGGSAVMIDKATGALKRFVLPDKENYQRLADARMLLPRH